MRSKIVACIFLAAALAFAACKFESSTWFDNNCTGNAVVSNAAHCATYGRQ